MPVADVADWTSDVKELYEVTYGMSIGTYALYGWRSGCGVESTVSMVRRATVATFTATGVPPSGITAANNLDAATFAGYQNIAVSTLGVNAAPVTAADVTVLAPVATGATTFQATSTTDVEAARSQDQKMMLIGISVGSLVMCLAWYGLYRWMCTGQARTALPEQHEKPHDSVEALRLSRVRSLRQDQVSVPMTGLVPGTAASEVHHHHHHHHHHHEADARVGSQTGGLVHGSSHHHSHHSHRHHHHHKQDEPPPLYTDEVSKAV